MLDPLFPLLLLVVMFLWDVVPSVAAVALVLVEEVEAGGPVSWNAALLSEE